MAPDRPAAVQRTPRPTIATERLDLRPMTPEDGRAIASGHEPRGLRFGAGYPSAATLEGIELFTGARALEAPGLQPWLIVRRADAALIGSIGHWLSGDGTTAIVGYDIAPPAQGQGYASEAFRGLIGYLFATGIRVVRADTYAEHAASRRVMEKAGLTFVRERAEEEDGRSVRMVDYEIRAD